MGWCAIATPQGCDVLPIASLEQHPVRLDAALENQATELVGTLLVDDQRVTVRFTRQ